MNNDTTQPREQASERDLFAAWLSRHIGSCNAPKFLAHEGMGDEYDEALKEYWKKYRAIPVAAPEAPTHDPKDRRIMFLEGLVRAYGPKSLQYDIEHPNDGLNSAESAEVERTMRSSASTGAAPLVPEVAASAPVHIWVSAGTNMEQTLRPAAAPSRNAAPLAEALQKLADYPLEDFALEAKPDSHKLFGACDWILTVGDVRKARAALTQQSAARPPCQEAEQLANRVRDLIADHVADNWPMVRHPLEEIEKKLRAINAGHLLKQADAAMSAATEQKEKK